MCEQQCCGESLNDKRFADFVVRLTSKGLEELEKLDAIAAKWGLEPLDMHVNPFRLAAARDEARKAGVALFDEDDWIGEDEQ